MQQAKKENQEVFVSNKNAGGSPSAKMELKLLG
jgi:hypothetical protein